MANIIDTKLKVTLSSFDETPQSNELEDEILYESGDSFIRIEEICDELQELASGYFNIDYLEECSAEISMGIRQSINEEVLQNICTNYDCSIIGVAWQFDNDYVDHFDLDSEVPVEDTETYFIIAESIEDSSDLKNNSNE